MSVHREEKIRICQVPCQPINFKQQISTSKLKDLAYDANLTTGNPGIAKITRRNCSLYSCQVHALENKLTTNFLLCLVSFLVARSIRTFVLDSRFFSAEIISLIYICIFYSFLYPHCTSFFFFLKPDALPTANRLPRA